MSFPGALRRELCVLKLRNDRLGRPPSRIRGQEGIRQIFSWLHTGKPGERVRLAVYEEHRGLGTSMLALTQESGLSARAGGRNFGIA